MPTLTKICGLTHPDALDVAVEAGVDMVGLVCHPASPRHLEADAMAALRGRIGARTQAVVVVVDPSDGLLDKIVQQVQPGMIQLHGQETPERVAQVKSRYGVQVIKALSVGSAEDVARAQRYEPVADMLLFDTKTPDAAMPGGQGIVFDWRLLQGYKSQRAWLIAGGIGAHNVLDAIAACDAKGVDASSCLESSRGVKDPEKIRAFMQAVRRL